MKCPKMSTVPTCVLPNGYCYKMSTVPKCLLPKCLLWQNVDSKNVYCAKMSTPKMSTVLKCQLSRQNPEGPFRKEISLIYKDFSRHFGILLKT